MQGTCHGGFKSCPFVSDKLKCAKDLFKEKEELWKWFFSRWISTQKKNHINNKLLQEVLKNTSISVVMQEVAKLKTVRYKMWQHYA